MPRLNLVETANDTLNIINNGYYEISDKKIVLNTEKIKNVKLYSPEYFPEISKKSDKAGKIIIKPVDSFDALDLCDTSEKTCVLNFASAKNAGGGFQRGAKAQEEDLCRRSTLYASIGTEKAFEMYKYNRENYNPLYSDYMLYSPYVTVIKNADYRLLTNPVDVSIITAAAVNRNIANEKCSSKEIYECMLKRAEKILCVAAENGDRNIILGAWGCGVFRNSVRDIAEIFRKLLIGENYLSLFDNVIFAAYSVKNAEIFNEYF